MANIYIEDIGSLCLFSYPCQHDILFSDGTCKHMSGTEVVDWCYKNKQNDCDGKYLDGNSPILHNIDDKTDLLFADGMAAFRVK